MAGYGFRDHPCESISEDLYLRAQAEFSGEKRLVFLYADLERWDNVLVARIRNKLEELYGLQETELLFLASHTHSGPVTGYSGLVASEDVVSDAYCETVFQAAVDAAGEAMQNMKEATLTRYNGRSCLNVFRRVWEDGKTIMAPNYEVPADRHLTVIAVRDAEGKLIGLQVHYPCHANIANGYDIHPDFPGVALRMLDEQFPDSTALFLQGCTGDLRPNSVCGDRFVPAPYPKVVEFAKRFVSNILEAMAGHGIAVGEPCKSDLIRLALPLENVKDEAELHQIQETGSDLDRAWAATVLKHGNREFETLEIMRVRYSGGLLLYAMNGEVVQEYAAFARTLDEDAVVAAYANGMIAYIPTAKEIIEGGYESKESPFWFGLAGTFSLDIERMIKNALKELSEE